VTDTGVGISEAELPRLFERFHRVLGSNGRSHEGTGIGLALVQVIIKTLSLRLFIFCDSFLFYWMMT